MKEASGYLNGTVKQPTFPTTHLTIVTTPAFTTAGTPLLAPTTTISVTPEADTKWQSLIPSEDEWESRDNWVKGLLIYNTKNPIGLGIKIKETAAKAWAFYVKRYEVTTKLAKLAAEQDLRNSMLATNHEWWWYQPEGT